MTEMFVAPDPTVTKKRVASQTLVRVALIVVRGTVPAGTGGKQRS